MAFFEYSPFAKSVRLGYECPKCSHDNIILVGVPEPDYSSDSHSDSINSDVIETECQHCKTVFELTLATGIGGGEGMFKNINDVSVLGEYNDRDGNEDLYDDERLETEATDEKDSVIPPTDIIAFNELRSCADIYRMYDKKQLDINPEFQRGEVWRNRAQTLFVDSLIKQPPIPSLCISLDVNTQKRLVIDGLQRITTIIKVLDPGSTWRLSRNTEVDNRISGRKVGEIRRDNPTLIEMLENVTIPITVLRCDYSKKQHMQYLFQIFNRLNSGGSKLYNQEIRNCIYNGPFNRMLKEEAKSQLWLLFTGATVEKVVRARFSHEERILRFLAFYYKSEGYSGKFSDFLNDFMGDNMNCDKMRLSQYKQLLHATLEVANKLTNKPDSKNVADAILVGIAKNLDKLRRVSTEKLDELNAKVMQSPEFSSDEIMEGLGQKEKVKGRINKAISIFGSD